MKYNNQFYYHLYEDNKELINFIKIFNKDSESFYSHWGNICRISYGIFDTTIEIDKGQYLIIVPVLKRESLSYDYFVLSEKEFEILTFNCFKDTEENSFLKNDDDIIDPFE